MLPIKLNAFLQEQNFKLKYLLEENLEEAVPFSNNWIDPYWTFKVYDETEDKENDEYIRTAMFTTILCNKDCFWLTDLFDGAHEDYQYFVRKLEFLCKRVTA